MKRNRFGVKRSAYTLKERSEIVEEYFKDGGALRDFCETKPYSYPSLSNWIRSSRRGDFIDVPNNNLSGFRRNVDILKVCYNYYEMALHGVCVLLVVNGCCCIGIEWLSICFRYRKTCRRIPLYSTWCWMHER